MKKMVCEGGLPPRFYGFAYFDPCRLGAIFYPIPLNLLVRGWKWLRYLVGFRLTRWEKKQFAIQKLAWRSGWETGHSTGYELGLQHNQDGMRQQIFRELINEIDSRRKERLNG